MPKSGGGLPLLLPWFAFSLSALVFLLFWHFTGYPQNGIVQQNLSAEEEKGKEQVLDGMDDGGFWKSSEFDISEWEERRLFPGEAGGTAKFILPNFPKGECGGLGNQMFRFASLYGIGRPLGRQPAFARYDHCMGPENHGNGLENFTEAELPFPVYKRHLKFVGTPWNETDTAPGFALECCKFDNPREKLVEFGKFGPKSTIRYVQTLANYLQSYKYFHPFRLQIRQIFQCSPELRQRTRQIHERMFESSSGGHQKNNTMKGHHWLEKGGGEAEWHPPPPPRHHRPHKLCVHTRRGDFQQLWFESKKEFTERAIRFLYQKLTETNGTAEEEKEEVDVVLFGEDKTFLESLQIGPIRPHLVRGLSRNEDFCMAIHTCHTLLLTASASTFGWWIGYLMRPGARVFYNADLNFTHYSPENFPPEWTPIRLEEEEGGRRMVKEEEDVKRVLATLREKKGRRRKKGMKIMNKMEHETESKSPPADPLRVFPKLSKMLSSAGHQ